MITWSHPEGGGPGTATCTLDGESYTVDWGSVPIKRQYPLAGFMTKHEHSEPTKPEVLEGEGWER